MSPKKQKNKSSNKDLDNFLKNYTQQNKKEEIILQKLQQEKAAQEKASQKKTAEKKNAFEKKFPHHIEIGLTPKDFCETTYKTKISSYVYKINTLNALIAQWYYFLEADIAEKTYLTETKKYPFIQHVSKNNRNIFDIIHGSAENVELAAYIDAMDAKKNAEFKSSEESIKDFFAYVQDKNGLEKFSQSDQELIKCYISILLYTQASKSCYTYSQEATRLFHALKNLKPGNCQIDKIIADYIQLIEDYNINNVGHGDKASNYACTSLIEKINEYIFFIEIVYETAQKLGISTLNPFKIKSNFTIKNYQLDFTCTYPETPAFSTLQTTTTTTVEITPKPETIAEVDAILTKSSLALKLPYTKMHKRVQMWLTEDSNYVFNTVKEDYLKNKPGLSNNPWFKPSIIFGHTFSQTCDGIILQYFPAYKVNSFQKQNNQHIPDYWAIIVPAYVQFDDGYSSHIWLTYAINDQGTIFHRCAQQRVNQDGDIAKKAEKTTCRSKNRN